MRTLPANFSTGLSSHYMMVWLVKLTGSAATYYWLSNKRGNTATSDVVLTESSVEKSYDSSLLARLIDGSQVSPIGEINNSIDISMGGNVASSSDVDLILLNQDRIDETIATYNLENRAVSIYVGFIPDGAAPTLEVTNMLCIWTGVFDSHEENFGQMVCHLVDSRDARHKTIPQTIIDKETYPYAPSDSIGEVLPILYGDFYTTDNDGVSLYYNIYDVCPAICINRTRNIYCVAGHFTHTYLRSYFHDTGMKNPAQLLFLNAAEDNTEDPTLSVDDSGLSTITVDSGKILGYYVTMFSYAAASNTITDFEKAINGLSTDYASIANTASETLTLCPDGLPQGELLDIGGLKIGAILDANIVSADSFQFVYETTAIDVDAGTTSPWEAFTYTAGKEVSSLMSENFQFRDNPDHAPTAETAKVKTLYLTLIFVISCNVSEIKAATRQRTSGYRRS